MHNLYNAKNNYLFGFPVPKVISRLNGLVMTLKRCKSRQCVYPWETLHPDGSVKSIREALHPRYDHFYEHEMPEVSFEECAQGFIVAVEGPQEPAIFGMDREAAKYAYRRGTHWSDWS